MIKFVLKKYQKYLFALTIVIIALAIIKTSQTPNSSGVVLNAFENTSSTASKAGKLKIDFLDVGQGDSALIITPNSEDILIDGGPNNKVAQKLGQYLPFDDRKIEYIILTHPHADHVDGLVEVLNRYQIGKVIMTGAVHTAPDYLEFLKLIKEKNIPTLAIESPQIIKIDNLEFIFLEPVKSCIGIKLENLNNSSIVFKLNYISSTVMFTGDFENEETLLASSSSLLKSDILKVGHHGSTNANDKKFLAEVDPKYAVISVGKDNSFGHPHYRTVYYLEQLGAQILRTDEMGDIKMESDGRDWQIIK